MLKNFNKKFENKINRDIIALMKIGISFYYGVENSPENRAKLISENGFENVITIDEPELKDQNLSLEQQVALFKKYNLNCSSLHMKYKAKDLPDFWKNTELGNKLEQNLIEDVINAKKFGFSCVVVHLFGEYSEIGKARLLNVLNYCEKYDLPLAIENIDCPEVFFKVFENIKHDYLKMCYDSGHNNVFDPQTEYFKDFSDKIIAVHLHDNSGANDDHTLNEFGSINWDKIAFNLANCPNLKSLDYELLLHSPHTNNLTEQEILEKCYKQAVQLKNSILNYKNKRT